MAGWTAASLFPSSTMRDLLNRAANPQLTEAQMRALTPEQKLKLSGGVTRRALDTITPASTTVTPSATGSGAAGAAGGAGTVIIPAATSGANAATSVVTPAPTSVIPPFLQGGNQQLPSQGMDALAQLIEALGLGQKQDPELVKAQTILAQQQAMQVARGNEAARQREASQAAMGYLQSQMKDAARYTTGSVGKILTQRYQDRANVLARDGQLNWLNMPSSSYSVPRQRGWTGPATPTPGFGF